MREREREGGRGRQRENERGRGWEREGERERHKVGLVCWVHLFLHRLVNGTVRSPAWFEKGVGGREGVRAVVYSL